MTDETKKLFDAPYKVCETRNGYNVICTNKVLPQLCWTTDKKDANRISHLPELYDALFDSVLRICSTCIGSNLSDTPLDDIGRYCRANCSVHKYTALLKKARDGE